jgi:type IV pilus assembly protein PilA
MLVELLVVMLIVGVLAAIAIPSLFNQRDKARDADAKAAVRTAETAMETYGTDHNGSYNGATAVDLTGIESALTGVDLADPVPGSAAGPPADNPQNSYTVSVTSDTGNVFSVTRHATGATEATCSTAGSGGCPTGGAWG